MQQSFSNSQNHWKHDKKYCVFWNGDIQHAKRASQQNLRHASHSDAKCADLHWIKQRLCQRSNCEKANCQSITYQHQSWRTNYRTHVGGDPGRWAWAQPAVSLGNEPNAHANGTNSIPNRYWIRHTFRQPLAVSLGVAGGRSGPWVSAPPLSVSVGKTGKNNGTAYVYDFYLLYVLSKSPISKCATPLIAHAWFVITSSTIRVYGKTQMRNKANV